MEIIHTIILGVVQGLTEFLPVSSSGHIAIANSILETSFNSDNYVLMNIVLHAATASSILYVFRVDVFNIFSGLLSNNKEQAQFSYKILISMIPTIIIGLFFEDIIKVLFSGENKFLKDLIGKDYILTLVGLMLLITALLLILADKSKPTNKNISLFSSMIIGCAQAIAILPGISRSGTTIAISVLLGIDKEESARFSFLMSVPLIIGIMLKEIYSLLIIQSYTVDYLDLFVGFFTALIIGIFACKWMINIVKNSQLKYFSYYCILVGVSVVSYNYISA